MIEPPKLIWGAAQWWPAAALVAAAMGVALLLSYRRASGSPGFRALAAGLKMLGIVVLVLCLLDPLFSGSRAKPGANQFVVLADNSRSMTLRDAGASSTRGEDLKASAGKASPWLAKLREDFDVRQYAFDAQLRDVPDFEAIAFDGGSSNLAAALSRVAGRYQGRPLAGAFVLTDGSATDAAAIERAVAQSSAAKLPPIYPVLFGREGPSDDVGVSQVTVAQTNFEDAPVTLSAQLTTAGHRGRNVVAQLLDESGKVVEQQTVKVEADGQPLSVRFRVKPQTPGLSFYRVRAAAEDRLDQFDDATKSSEATLANNARLATVDRGRGPYRVLYVGGRPNWEFKFLQRAIAFDDQVQLLGLLRIAKREPKFNFLARSGESANPLFRGFDGTNKDQVEQYDQPVIVRLGTLDETELRGGFPKAADELFRYHAVILDDVEAEFFSQDQMQLLKDFVRQRGGGLLMLGGQESFRNGKFDRTPVGELMPVYLDETEPAPPLPDARHRMLLTREGWLEPWVRLRDGEAAENARIEQMPAFHTLNSVRGIKPGATVLARAADDSGTAVPALVEHRFGQGRVAALLLGDLWRWGLRRPPEATNDMEKAWRQTVRWLVADVPKRVDLTVEPRAGTDDAEGTVTLAVQVRDPAFAPLDNAAVTVSVTTPDGGKFDLRADASPTRPGRYDASYFPRKPGAYRATATATSADGSPAGDAVAGWVSEPAAEEFRSLQPNVALLDRIARATGGQVVKASELPAFVTTLPTRNAPIIEPYTRPLWHQGWVFLLAIACFTAEWGLRRWKGLA